MKLIMIFVITIVLSMVVLLTNPVFPASIVLLNNITIKGRITGEEPGKIFMEEPGTNRKRSIEKMKIKHIKYSESEAKGRIKGDVSSANVKSHKGDVIIGLISYEDDNEIRLIVTETRKTHVLEKKKIKSIEYYEKFKATKREVEIAEEIKKEIEEREKAHSRLSIKRYELRAGVLGGVTMPVGSTSQVLDMGYGSSIWLSTNVLFLHKLSFMKNIMSRHTATRTNLIWENGYYIVTGRSMRDYGGNNEINAQFMPFIIAIAYVFPVEIAPKKAILFMPKLGFGYTMISATIGETQIRSNDFTLLPGMIIAYSFYKGFQVFSNIDNFIFFEQSTGMQLRFQLGVNYLIF